MNYTKIYNQIVDRARNRQLEGYAERHHIIPKCMGGSNDWDNLVDLTAREHFLAHWLLTEIYPDNNKLKFAFRAMCNQTNNKNQSRDYHISSRVYEYAKSNIRHSEETKQKLCKPKPKGFGEKIRKARTSTKRSLETIKKIKNSLKKSIKEHGSGFNLGSTWSDKSKQQHSINRTGKNNPNFGKKLSPEHKFLLKKRKKKIGQYTLENELIKIWNSGADIVNELGISRDQIINCCKLRRKDFKGFVWKYEK